MVLCDAVIMGDRAAAQKWKTTIRTVQRYRANLENDDKLRSYVMEFHKKQHETWAHQIPEVLTRAMAFFETVFVENLEGGTRNPETNTALTGALETLADIELTRSIIAERLNRLDNDNSQIQS
jgi:hypothetical protein